MAGSRLRSRMDIIRASVRAEMMRGGGEVGGEEEEEEMEKTVAYTERRHMDLFCFGVLG